MEIALGTPPSYSLEYPNYAGGLPFGKYVYGASGSMGLADSVYLARTFVGSEQASSSDFGSAVYMSSGLDNGINFPNDPAEGRYEVISGFDSKEPAS